jgi:hypothetical protein
MRLTIVNKIQQDAPVLKSFKKFFYSLLFCSTCFGHSCAHHQEPLFFLHSQPPVYPVSLRTSIGTSTKNCTRQQQPSGLITNAATQGKPEAANAGRIEAPDDGHKSARNMLSRIGENKKVF